MSALGGSGHAAPKEGLIVYNKMTELTRYGIPLLDGLDFEKNAPPRPCHSGRVSELAGLCDGDLHLSCTLPIELSILRI
jgi:hypothetical protein